MRCCFFGSGEEVQPLNTDKAASTNNHLSLERIMLIMQAVDPFVTGILQSVVNSFHITDGRVTEGVKLTNDILPLVMSFIFIILKLQSNSNLQTANDKPTSLLNSNLGEHKPVSDSIDSDVATALKNQISTLDKVMMYNVTICAFLIASLPVIQSEVKGSNETFNDSITFAITILPMIRAFIYGICKILMDASSDELANPSQSNRAPSLN